MRWLLTGTIILAVAGLNTSAANGQVCRAGSGMHIGHGPQTPQVFTLNTTLPLSSSPTEIRSQPISLGDHHRSRPALLITLIWQGNSRQLILTSNSPYPEAPGMMHHHSPQPESRRIRIFGHGLHFPSRNRSLGIQSPGFQMHGQSSR